LLTNTKLSGDEKKVKQRIQILIQAHERKQHFTRLKQILKPKEAGGLSYILVPEDFNIDTFPYDPNKVQTWEAIHDQELIQNYIQKRNTLWSGSGNTVHNTTTRKNRLASQHPHSKRIVARSHSD
jgi:hypothetical protein